MILINGTYHAFGESNNSDILLVRNTHGDDVWESFAKVGGSIADDGPFPLRTGITDGWTPTGNFLDLGHDRGYGKVYVDPDNQYLFLAVHSAAKASPRPSQFQAAFVNPDNWTRHDGTAGVAANPILSSIAEHDYRECRAFPDSDPDNDWIILYNSAQVGDSGYKT